MARVFVGIDWGSKVHSMCVVDGLGRQLWEGEVEHQGDAIRSAVEKAVSLAGGDPAQLSVGMEAPHGAFLEAFIERGAEVYSINPKQLDRFRDRYSNGGAKDDELDAFVLADTLRTDARLYRRVVVPEPLMLTLREVSRTHEAVVKQTLATANQIREQLQRYYPQMAGLGDWHRERWLWDLFEKAPMPAAVPRLSTSWIKKLLKTHGIRRYTPLEVFQRLSETALPVADGVAEAASEHIALLLPILRAQHAQREACTKRLGELMESCSKAPEDEESDPERSHRDAAILLSLPGIGIRNGAAMLAEATMALRERDYQAFRRLSAIAPVTSHTGGKKKKQLRGSLVRQRRSCNGRLRTAVFQWASIAVRCEDRAKRHYESLRKRGHSYARALRGVADRLVRMMFAMLNAGEFYDPKRRQISC